MTVWILYGYATICLPIQGTSFLLKRMHSFCVWDGLRSGKYISKLYLKKKTGPKPWTMLTEEFGRSPKGSRSFEGVGGWL